MRDHVAVETPNWDTKQRCSCGYKSASRCEMWKHWADEREAEVARLHRELDRALDTLRGTVNLYGWFTTPEPEPLRIARAVLAAHDREPG